MTATPKSEIAKEKLCKANNKFYQRTINKLSLIGVGLKNEVDLHDINETAEHTISAITNEEGMKLMLSAQMSAIHELQQRLSIFAYNVSMPDVQMNYINSIVKLSNVFAQQVSLMNKLKSDSQRKVTVEQVHVHSGGQAVVGSIESINRGD